MEINHRVGIKIEIADNFKLKYKESTRNLKLGHKIREPGALYHDA